MPRAGRSVTIEGTTMTTIFQANSAGGSDGGYAREVFFRVANASAKALRVYVNATAEEESSFATIEIGESRSFFSATGFSVIKVAAEDSGIATYSWHITGV